MQIKSILLISLVVCLACVFHQASQSHRLHPPPPRICGSGPGSPPVTAARIKLRDGRHLAYQEHGLPVEKARHRFVFIHAFDCCRHHVALPSQETIDALGVYIVSIDRPGYGESDPHPKRTIKSLALDIEELADQLGLGAKFYIYGFSMGGMGVWGCLKYIPHRLAGATLLAPAINYWWNGLPHNLSSEAYGTLLPQDRWALRVAHYTPWLTYWWNTQAQQQRWLLPFPQPFSVIEGNFDAYPPADKAVIHRMISSGALLFGQGPVRQQGEFESIHSDLNVGFGRWGFSPLELSDPFAGDEGGGRSGEEGLGVHLWQGDEDLMVPVKLQQYIVQRLPWVRYHELKGAGHLFMLEEGFGDSIIKTQLLS